MQPDSIRLVTVDNANRDFAKKSMGSYGAQQSINLGQAMRKLRKYEATKIVARGDSTTYGHDTVSADKVAADPVPAHDGSVHTATRSPKPWPAALQDYMNQGRGVSNVTVLNQGYSGDYVKRGYDRWLNNVGADITLISYGINDASASYVPDQYRGSIPEYINWLEKMMIRDIEWGSAVIFLTPTRQLGQTGNVDTDSYRNALDSLASKHGIPVIDGETFLATSMRDAWSDGNHLSTKGNAIMGARVAAMLFAESPLNPQRVTGGSKLLTRPTTDNLVIPATGTTFSNSTGYPTPQDNVTGQGTALLFTATGHALWSFYTDAPDLVALPSVYIVGGDATETGGSLTATLDFGVEQGENYIDRAVDINPVTYASPANSTVVGPITGTASVYNASPKDSPEPKYIRISTPGWHTIRFTPAKSVTSTSIILHGMMFLGYQEYNNTRQLLVPAPTQVAKGAYTVAVPAAYNEASDILSTSVKWKDMYAAVNGEAFSSGYYEASPIKMTVTSYGGAIIEYLLFTTIASDGSFVTDLAAVPVDQAPISAAGNKIQLVKTLRTTSLSTTNVAPDANTVARELASVAYTGSTGNLELNWKTLLADGTTAKNMKRNFTLAFQVL